MNKKQKLLLNMVVMVKIPVLPKCKLLYWLHKLTIYKLTLQSYKKDHHGRRGLLRMVSRGRKLLDYLKRTNLELYSSLIARLGLRR